MIAQRSLWVRLKLAQDKGLVSWQSISIAIILYESTPADCSFKVVRRNLDDTEAEILCEGTRSSKTRAGSGESDARKGCNQVDAEK